jgi:hypothetical protein
MYSRAEQDRCTASILRLRRRLSQKGRGRAGPALLQQHRNDSHLAEVSTMPEAHQFLLTVLWYQALLEIRPDARLFASVVHRR